MSDKPLIKTIAGQVEEQAYLDLYAYQTQLTPKLDQLTGAFDQATINEIVLWKVDRYALLSEKALAALNTIPSQGVVEEQLGKQVLELLLATKGIRLAMASTILRFKNPEFFQIIDERAYRVIYGEKLPSSTVVAKQVKLYFDYLQKLRGIAKDYNLAFSSLDRVLYELDKELNKGIKIR